MRISDWSSDVCSSDLARWTHEEAAVLAEVSQAMEIQRPVQIDPALRVLRNRPHEVAEPAHLAFEVQPGVADTPLAPVQREPDRLCRIVRSPRQCPQVEVKIGRAHV